MNTRGSQRSIQASDQTAKIGAGNSREDRGGEASEVCDVVLWQANERAVISPWQSCLRSQQRSSGLVVALRAANGVVVAAGTAGGVVQQRSPMWSAVAIRQEVTKVGARQRSEERHQKSHT